MKKKGMEMEMLGWWLIGLVVLVVVLGAYVVLKGKGGNYLDVIKNLFRFGK